METKERLMISGLKLYAQKGLNGVTLDDILEDSNVKKGSFYHFFKNKDELLERSLEAYFLPIIVGRAEQLRSSKLPFKETVELFYRNVVSQTQGMLTQLIGDNAIKARDIGLLMLESIRAQKFANTSFSTNQRQIRDIMIEKIVREQQYKTLPSGISGGEIATLIITCGEGALYLSSWNTSLYSNDEVLDVCFHHLWNYLENMLDKETV